MDGVPSELWQCAGRMIFRLGQISIIHRMKSKSTMLADAIVYRLITILVGAFPFASVIQVILLERNDG
jgi:hypothetical protein